jgi:hypothetical protein
MLTLSRSVGRHGANSASDVGAIQFLLNLNISRLIPLAPLAVDGHSGIKTVGMIEEFQRRVLGLTHPDGRVDPDKETLRVLTAAISVSAPANKTARFESVRGAGRLNQMMIGRIKINNQTYVFRSGGHGRGNLPVGTYTVTAHRWNRSDAGYRVGSVGYSFAMSNRYDPRVHDTRTALLIHPDGGPVGTQGCIGIVGCARTQRAFREDMRAELNRNHGRFTLTVRQL